MNNSSKKDYYKLVYAHEIPEQFPWSGTASDIKDGFIHLSNDHDIDRIYNKFFKNADNKAVYVMTINPDYLSLDKLKIEANKPGGNKYPHYYGSINKNSIVLIRLY